MYPPLSISADEVNYLVYRYMIESGFRHSTFAFEHESQISQKLDQFRPLEIRPGMLISLLHKSLQLMQVELHMEEDGTERSCEATLSLLFPHNCISPTTPSDGVIRSLPLNQGNRIRKLSELPNSKSIDAGSMVKRKDKLKFNSSSDKKKNKSDRFSSTKSTKKVISNGTADDTMDIDEPENHYDGDGMDPLGNEVIVQVDIDDAVCPMNSSEPVITLQGTDERYYVSAWNPVDDSLLASGSLNSVVGLWTIPHSNGRFSNVIYLDHSSSPPNNQLSTPHPSYHGTPTMVTAIAWSPDGEQLATGTCHSIIRVFTKAGTLLQSFFVPYNNDSSNPDDKPDPGVNNPVLELAFSSDSSLLACGTTSGNLIIWDVNKHRKVYSIKCSAAVMAFSWTYNYVLAAGSSDHLVRIIDIPKSMVTILAGHQGDVNHVAWDSTHTLLASCADDGTVRIWSHENIATAANSPSNQYNSATAVLRGHEGEVITMDWNPRPPGRAPQLATVGTDRVVRIWDVSTASCIYAIDRDVQTHCVLSYSPDGKYLACGSDDQYLYLWTSTAQLVKTFFGYSGILDLRFNRKGDRLAVCFGTSRLAILPFGTMISSSSTITTTTSGNNNQSSSSPTSTPSLIPLVTNNNNVQTVVT